MPIIYVCSHFHFSAYLKCTSTKFSLLKVALVSCAQDEQQSISEVEKLTKDRSVHTHSVLEKLVLSQCPEDVQELTLSDLLKWKLWPPLIKAFGMTQLKLLHSSISDVN